VILLLIALVEFARAGGPTYVAGVSYFNSGLAGQPITWPNGAITYFTDQGSLSPILAGPAADAFVADAFSRWTAISTAAGTATRAGQLAEDVNGANVILNADRTITMPADIQPSATATPVAVAYDADGGDRRLDGHGSQHGLLHQRGVRRRRRLHPRRSLRPCPGDPGRQMREDRRQFARVPQPMGRGTRVPLCTCRI